MLISQLRLLDVTAQLKRSAHAAFDLAINYVQANGRTGLFFRRLKLLPMWQHRRLSVRSMIDCLVNATACRPLSPFKEQEVKTSG